MRCTAFEEPIALRETEWDDSLFEHVSSCADCAELTNEFRVLDALLADASSIELPEGLVSSVKTAVAFELETLRGHENGTRLDLKAFIKRWLMPYTVATAASLVITSSLLWTLLVGGSHFVQEGAVLVPEDFQSGEVVFLDAYRGDGDGSARISAGEFSASRRNFSAESPSVNPGGSIMTIVNSMTSGRIRTDDIVLIASVRADGSARLERLVQPLADSRTVHEIETAFSKTGDDSPFVPAVIDNRPDTAQIVFTIKRVDVYASAADR